MNRWTCKQLISRIQNPQPYVIDQIQEHENMVLKEPLKITKMKYHIVISKQK